MNTYQYFDEYGNCWHNMPDSITTALRQVTDAVKVEADKCDMTEARALWLEVAMDIHADCCEYMMRRGVNTRIARREA